jgi:hypothetical protein
MGSLPRIGFDTSTINALQRDGLDSEALIRGIQSGYRVLLLGENADEVLSTPAIKSLRRESLVGLLQRLLVSGEFLWPPNYVVELLATAYFKNPSGFSWQKVSVRARAYERAIVDRDFTDALCAQQRAEQFEHEKKWRAMWNSARLAADNRLAAEQAKRPTSYHDFFVNTAVPAGLLSHFGGILCRRFSGRQVSDAEIEAFIEICPPLRAVCHSVVMSFYVQSLRLRQPGDPRPPGRNDLMMATFLPYCTKFVTDDYPQEICLREIAGEASIDCDVLSFEKFASGFMVAAG